MNRLNSIKSEMLPSSWKLLPVGKVLLDTQYGTNEPAVTSGNTRVVGMKDIQEGKIILNDLSRSDLSEDERQNYLLCRGDLLLNRTNSYDLVGKVGLFESDEEAAFASYLVRLKVDRKQVLSTYLNFWLNGQAAQTVVKKIATRAISQANVNPSEFKKHCFVPLPPLPEQAAIADLLSTWDEAIDKTERLIAVKEKQKKSTMQSLLTGKKRLTGFQKPWSEFHLGELFKERSERGNYHLPLLSITRENGVIPRSEDRKDTSSEDKSNYLRICPGDIGYNTMRMWQGVSALSSFEGIVSPAYTICTPKKGVDGEFMAYLFKLPRVVNLFYRYSQGLTSDTWNLKYHHFRQIRVTIPEIKEQKAIARVLKGCDEEISLLKQQADALRRQKRGLMQKLLTGTWRVKTTKEAA
ncbi:restriction endonuclease subunit S [Geobacter sulfurreducens]|uniref:restriction endonuclease subunit S n=1 Tax=Geobacter sulfurreducens TaxID=35554 RepID=UPI002BCE6035|nr:restriction endonuclease subunit S [Geobacter sulfurreducens]HML79392.1 restriction endonuclease subunit S [Geobacter sulfurreducens]